MVPTYRERTRTPFHHSEIEPQRGNVLKRSLTLEPGFQGPNPSPGTHWLYDTLHLAALTLSFVKQIYSEDP